MLVVLIDLNVELKLEWYHNNLDLIWSVSKIIFLVKISTFFYTFLLHKSADMCVELATLNKVKYRFIFQNKNTSICLK